MATSTLQAVTTYTATNALQPRSSTPSDIPQFTDTRPTQVYEATIELPAYGDYILIPLPANWTAVYQISVINVDASRYCAITLTDSGPYLMLTPDGGTFATSIGTAASFSGGTPFTPLNQMYMAEVQSDGSASPAGTGCTVYIYATGV